MRSGGRSAAGALCFIVEIVAITLTIFAVPARAEEPAPLLDYCAPPIVPPCLGELKAHPEALAACEPIADGYVASVFRYRVCLTHETERAVREANEAIAKLRCAQKRGPC